MSPQHADIQHPPRRSFGPAACTAYRQRGFCIHPGRIPAGWLVWAHASLESILGGLRDDEKPGGVFVHDLHGSHAAMAGFCVQPFFQELCADLIGPESYLCWTQMIAKVPGRSGPFAWHQDAQYALASGGEDRASIDSESPTDQVVCWVAITPATRDNGALLVAPGMHTQGLLPHVWDAGAKAWDCSAVVEHSELAELPAGGVVVFSRFTPHASGPNLTASTRLGLQIAFRRKPRVSDAGRTVRMSDPPAEDATTR